MTLTSPASSVNCCRRRCNNWDRRSTTATAAPAPTAACPSGGNLSGNWQFGGAWPFDSLDHAQPLVLQEDAGGRLSGGNPVRYVVLATDPQAMWGCPTSIHTGNQVLICLHPTSWNSSITLTGTVNGSTISGTAKHYSDVVNFTLTRVPVRETLRNQIPTSYPNVGGTWYREGNTSKPASIQQNGGTLRLVNEAGQASGAHFQNGAIIAGDWNGLVGTLTNGGRRISWANNSSWQR